jgi:hypothetical protein
MVKCGYHPRMGIGLKEFCAGLTEAVGIKAALHSRSLSDQLAIEKDEFSVVRALVRNEIGRASNEGEKARLEALDALLVLGEFFLNLRKSTRANDLHSEVDNRADEFIAKLIDFDEAWKNELLDRPLDERAANALSHFLQIHEGAAA